MERDKQQAGPQGPASSTNQKPDSAIGDGLLKEARAVIDEYRLLARDHIRLAALETRQAGESIVRMVVTGMVAGGVAAMTWIALVGAVVAFVVENNWLSASACLLITGLLHAVVVVMLAFVIRKQGRGLLFSAFVQELDPRLTGEADEERPEAQTTPARKQAEQKANSDPTS
ncbi:hypothetical protein CWE12_03835 [Aliidiomarina sedimenti]|uniref:Phage holin family protein n=1 Tax=Aliidiomarina sedimenti TaxID=1933879 RepID=A0ABY0C2W0_9GAMM|nr:phage holin family protein [Aliidiomarina sedimenti]RUO32131.1 hypothetical protein CWE12_03835 [Aliidiomarina sedimenti]